MKRLFLLVIFIALVATNALAGETKQPTAPGAYSIDLSRYDFIDSSLNVIQYPKGNAAFTPKKRARKISKALRAYASMVASADKGGVRVVE